MFVEVLLPLPLKQLFYYRVPEEIQSNIQNFIRVLVPFGKSKIYTAIVINVHLSIDVDYPIKPIIDTLDDFPVILPVHFKFWQWIADYYMASVGEVMNAAFPAVFKLENKLQILIDTEFKNFDKLTEKEKMVWSFINEQNIISLEKLQKIFKKSVYGVVKHLRDKHSIIIEEKIKEGYKPKFETVLFLTEPYCSQKQLDEGFKQLKRSPVQTDLLMEFVQSSGFLTSNNNCLSRTELLRKINSPSALKGLISKGILTEQKKNISHLINISNQIFPVNPLTPEQSKAYKAIKTLFKQQNVVLLHGITSSGKTELYIHLMQEIIDAGKQVLYLLPEIALTAQIINRLRRHFGDKIGVYHSKFNDNEKVDIWNKVKSINTGDTYDIILGVRSAIFLPFHDLGLVIVDEEHENTFKQQDPAPRYHARDAAIYLATYFDAKVLLGSATPSMETYFNSHVLNKYGYVLLNQRFKEIMLPEIEVVDIKKQRKQNRMRLSFSHVLLNEIEKTLNAGEQIILFQNRRGYAPYMTCEKCGYVPECKNCDVSLTYHKYKNKLVCHYCDFDEPIPHHCPECGGHLELNKGIGTEKLEEEINLLFPKAKTCRMDLDSMRKKHAHEEIITQFENKEIDILIGTQMVSKGLDFEHVNLVGIVDMDSLLFFPNFRAYERAFQLIIQVSGRAGRSIKQGKVVLQTIQPNSQLVNNIINYNYLKFAKDQLSERKEYGYPPYTKLIHLSIRHSDWKKVEIAAHKTAEKIKRIFNNRVLGPTEPIISKVKNQYIREIIIKVERTKSQQKAKDLLQAALESLQNEAFFKGISFQVEID